MPIPIGQVEQFEGMEITIQPGVPWQIGGSFVVSSAPVTLKVVRDIRDVVRKHKNLELTDEDWRHLTRNGK